MTDWRHKAICRDEDPALFQPVGNSGPALLQIAEAKAVCRHCPVINDCREWALTRGEPAGIWGALTEDERREIRSRRPTAPKTPKPVMCTTGKHEMTPDNTRPKDGRCRECIRRWADARKERAQVA